MSRFDQLSSYFNEKERKKLDNQAKKNVDGLPEMTVDEIRLSCLENNGYETAELNDKLYLHFRGFRKIENLDAYTGCKALWLDSNGFSVIENLDHLVELRCLYLSKNLISGISGLNSLANLSILDLSNNRIAKIANLSCCVNLQTLNVSHNAISTAEGIEHLQHCASLSNLDITSNRLPSEDAVFEYLQKIPMLVTLSINGNDVTKTGGFRKKMIHMLPKLGYLDRPIDEQERTFANAFMAGGAGAEKEAREKWKDDQAAKRVREMEEFRLWQEQQREVRKAELAAGRGRSIITDFTPEQAAQRKAEAEAAADAERKLSDIGVGKLATKYWQVEARGGDLDEAAAELLQQHADGASAEVNDAHSASKCEGVEAVLESKTGVEQADEEVQQQHPIPPSSEPIAATDAVVTSTEDQHTVVKVDDDTVVEVADVKLELAAEKPVDTVAMTAAQAAKQELEEQREREMRVQESLLIYRRQLEKEKRKLDADNRRATQSTSAETETKEGGEPQWSEDDYMRGLRESAAVNGTWSADESRVVVLQDDGSEATRPLYWSEAMDMELARLVRDCVFDFDEIGDKMRAAAREGKIDVAANSSSGVEAVLSSDACRLRWSELDATQWGETGDATALDTVFKICIDASMLGKGHGAQPSYAALSTRAAGAVPTYLSPPTSFPSVQDLVDDDEELELD